MERNDNVVTISFIVDRVPFYLQLYFYLNTYVGMLNGSIVRAKLKPLTAWLFLTNFVLRLTDKGTSG